jgi:hypothetical protein
MPIPGKGGESRRFKGLAISARPMTRKKAGHMIIFYAIRRI